MLSMPKLKKCHGRRKQITLPSGVQPGRVLRFTTYNSQCQPHKETRKLSARLSSLRNHCQWQRGYRNCTEVWSIKSKDLTLPELSRNVARVCPPRYRDKPVLITSPFLRPPIFLGISDTVIPTPSYRRLYLGYGRS